MNRLLSIPMITLNCLAALLVMIYHVLIETAAIQWNRAATKRITWNDEIKITLRLDIV